MKHFGVMIAFALLFAGIASIVKIQTAEYTIAIALCMPFIHILSSVICKYMGWNK